MNAIAPQPTASTPRYDMYRGVHKGLRAALGECLYAVGRLDCGDPECLPATLVQVEELLDLFAAHLRHENRFIHPAMEVHRPGSAAQGILEHLEHERAIAELQRMTAAVAQSSGPAQLDAAHQLYHQLTLFAAENLEHMHREETAHNTVLWASHSDTELAAIEGALVASIPPEQMARYLRWMLPAMNGAERAGLLAGIQQGAPAEAFESALAIAKARLSTAEWTRLCRALAINPAG